MNLLLFIQTKLATPSIFACVTCNKELQDAIYNSTFFPNLLTMLSAFFVLIAINIISTWLATKKYKARILANPNVKELASVPLTSASLILGIGIGGFADGIVLHQVLQWHEMLTNKIAADTVLNKSVNMFWDGIFHLFTLITTTVGVILLWKLLNRRNINRSGYLLSGGFFSGWGLFNLVEGIIDHHILGLHNVRKLTPNQDAWNYGFLAFGIVLLLLGAILIRKGKKEAFIV